MTTIANLVIAASVDASGVRSGLSQAQQYTSQYVQQVTLAQQRLAANARELNSLQAESGKTYMMSRTAFDAWGASIARAQAEQRRLTAELSMAKQALDDYSGAGARAARTMALQEIAAYKMDAAMRASATGTEVLATAQASLSGAAVGLGTALATLGIAAGGKGVLDAAARYQTLGVVMDVVGKNAGFSQKEVAKFETGLERTGISMIQSRNNIARMAAAHLDLAKATELGRLAQNAAVIADINSSDAFERLVSGIATGQPRILRTMGIFVEFGQAEKKWADEHHRTTESLTNTEKEGIRLNATLEFGTKIAGAYEAAMGTVGKELKSTERYLENVKVKAGTAFLPEYANVVKKYADTLKAMGEDAPLVAAGLTAVATAIGSIAVAITTVKVASVALSATPLGAGIAAVVGGLAIAAGIYADSVASARKQTAEFNDNIKELSKSSLQASITGAIEEIHIAQKKMNDLTAQGRGEGTRNVDDPIFGDTPFEKAKKHFTEMVDMLKKLRAQQALNALPIVKPTETPGMDPVSEAALRKQQEAWAKMEGIIRLAGTGGVQSTPGFAQALAGKRADAVATSSELVERLKLMQELGRGAGAEFDQIVAALIITDKYVDQLNQKEGVTNAQLRAQLANRAALNALNAAAGLNNLPSGMVDPSIFAQVARAKQAAQLAKGAGLAGASNAAELEAAANIQRERAVSIIRNMVEQLGSRNDLTADEQKMLAQMVDLMDQLGVKTVTAKEGWAGVQQGMKGALEMLDAIGAGQSSFAGILRGGQSFADAMKKFSAAKEKGDKQEGGAFGSVASIASMLGPAGQAIGATMQVFSSLKGIFMHHDETLERNNARLEAMRNALVDTRGVGGMSDALRAIQQWRSIVGQGDFSSGNGNQGLDRIVQATGLTLAQFNKMATDLGIEFGKGTAWVTAFEEALKLSVSAANHFSASLEDQTALRALHDRVFGKDSQADVINRNLDILKQFAPKIAASFDGIDTATADGREKLRDALKTLVTMIEQNALTPDMLGSLKGVKDLVGIIDGVVGALDGVTEAANQASSSLTNVPSWYKVDAARWAAANPMGPPDIATSPIKPSQIKPGGLGTPIGTTGGTATQGVNIYGDVYIDAKGITPDDIWKSVSKVGQQKSMTHFGTTQRVGDAMGLA